MANKMRWRIEKEEAIFLSPAPLSLIEIGDFVFRTARGVKPAREFLQVTTKALSVKVRREIRRNFRAVFLGVAMTPSQSGSLASVRIATAGVFAYDCPDRCDFRRGDLFGLDVLRVGLCNQEIRPVDDPAEAIGRVWKDRPAGGGELLIEIEAEK